MKCLTSGLSLEICNIEAPSWPQLAEADRHSEDTASLPLTSQPFHWPPGYVCATNSRPVLESGGISERDLAFPGGALDVNALLWGVVW